MSGNHSPGHATPGELSALAQRLFPEGPLKLRLLQRYRPYLCPYHELLPLVPPGSRVLDVGCGGGLFLGLLAARGQLREGLGLDLSREAIDVARRMAGHLAGGDAEASLEFATADVAQQDLPDAGRTYDVVSMIDLLHHLPPPRQRHVFQAAAARVRPGGYLLYKDMCRRPLWRNAANRLHDLLLARQWIHYVPIDEVQAWAAEQGLVVDHAATINQWCYGHELRRFQRPT